MFEDYRKCLFEKKEFTHKQRVGSHNYKLYTEEVVQQSTSLENDKKYLLTKEQAKKLKKKANRHARFGT